MPYATNDELPSAVRDRYSDRCQTVFRDAFNAEMERHGDEQRAMAYGHTAANNCMTATGEAKAARSVKFIGPDTLEGLAIPFGGLFDFPDGRAAKDFDGEDFGPDTDFCLDWFGKSGRPLLFEHGFDEALKGTVVGRQIDYEIRDEGIWARTQLDRAARYRKAIDQLVEEGALGYSSGAMPHLVTKRADGHITRWPWVELSVTPIPSAGPLSGVYYVKATTLVAHLAGLESAPDETQAPASGKAGRVLSAASRARLGGHPTSLRGIADDLDEFLTTADAIPDESARKAIDDISAAIRAEALRAERLFAGVLGVHPE